MEKKAIAIVCVLIISLSIFVSCGRKGSIFENARWGLKIEDAEGGVHALVTDAEGNTVLTDDGKLAVYATDKWGNYVKLDGGELLTDSITFPEKLVDEKKARVETPQYIFELPEDWEPDDDQNFVNKNNKKILFQLPVLSDLKSRTLEDAVDTQLQFIDMINESGELKNKIVSTAEKKTLKIGDDSYKCVVVVSKLVSGNNEPVTEERFYFIEIGNSLMQILFACNDKAAIGTVDDFELISNGLTIKDIVAEETTTAAAAK